MFQKITSLLLFVVILLSGLLLFSYFSAEENNKEEAKENNHLPIVKHGNSSSVFLTKKGIIEETNKKRNEFDVSIFVESNKLNEIARIKVEKMFSEQYFAHFSPEGIGVSDIATENGYEYMIIGDNLAMGPYENDKELVKAWMDSPGHRENLLDKRYMEIGVAVKEGYFENNKTWIAVQVFGLPSSACPITDDSIEKEIKEKNAYAKNLKEEIGIIGEEIDSIIFKSGEEYLNKVERYNSLVAEYNELVSALEILIEKHNNQIKEEEECLREIGVY